MSVLVKYLYNPLNNLGIEWRVTSTTTTKSAFSSLALCFPQHKFAVLQTFSSIYDVTRRYQVNNNYMFLLFFCLLVDKKACCVIHLTMLPCFLTSSLLL